jgi:branched-chain amino acid aminotransferase
MAAQSYDKLEGVIWYNGKLVPWQDAHVHVLTHGLHYASAVFEGQRAYEGQVFKLEEHTSRLFNSARIMDMVIPYSEAELNQANRDVLAANKIVDGYVRPIAWRGSEMMGVSAQSNRINVAIAAWQWPSYFDPEARMKGIKLKMTPWRRPDPRTAPVHAKAAGLYMICTLSKHLAEKEGYHDALFLDWRGQIAEATGANIFFVIDGKLHTPTPDCFLDGITRRTVIGLARARQIPVIERAMLPEDMGKASEAFLTGSAAEITPIGEIEGGYRYTPGAITKQLIEDFDNAKRPAQRAA